MYLTETRSNIVVVQRDAKIQAHTEDMFTSTATDISPGGRAVKRSAVSVRWHKLAERFSITGLLCILLKNFKTITIFMITQSVAKSKE